ncbi:hypothetical protein HZH66_001254 [Vespula vulgaris]|uniref:Uncharacterized protein n=1 Tax=Vespula vulgaris TaxID=7454 RepID=A0A834KT40_VESVU|nr:hypothetical protein HZH66_001254 [Vespula vulgaris]
MFYIALKLNYCLLFQPTIFGTVASDLNPKDGNSRRRAEAFALLSLNKTPLFSRRYEEEKEKFALISRKTKRNSRMMWVMISRELSLGNGLGVMARAELRSLHLISSLPAAGSVLPSS